MTELPRWNVRLDATRPIPNFSDLIAIVNQHFRVHQDVENVLGPYNARQRSSGLPYTPPDREFLQSVIRQGSMNDFSYAAYLSSITRFCQQHKGNRAVPATHPSTIHSIQLPLPAFELKHAGQDTEVHVIGAAEPLLVKGLRDLDNVKFIIVRPKLSQLGTASATNWEVLFFRSNIGYVPDWCDSFLNTRYAGLVG